MQKRTNINQTLDKVLNVLKKSIATRGYPPTVRELMQELNVTSTSTVKYYLDKLEEKQLIKKSNNKKRAIELSLKDFTNIRDDIIQVKLLGNVAAGIPIEEIEDYSEIFSFSSNFINSSGNLFMLNVKGNSMINAGILDKDKVIVRQQEEVNNGEIAVVDINNEVTLKKFFKEKNIIRLQPENDSMEPIYCKPNEVKILGKVISVIRNI